MPGVLLPRLLGAVVGFAFIYPQNPLWDPTPRAHFLSLPFQCQEDFPGEGLLGHPPALGLLFIGYLSAEHKAGR